MRYQIYEAKSVKYDAQQRVGVILYQHFNFGGKHLATIYFKKDLVSAALNLIKLKGTVDKLKAKDDIDQIDAILTSYYSEYGYDPVAADLLDKRILKEYPVIGRINQLPSLKISSGLKNDSLPVVNPIISNLNQDRYGIMFDVLSKEGLVHKLEDFVDRIE